MGTGDYVETAIKNKVCWELLLVLLCSVFFTGQTLLVISVALIAGLTLPNMVLYKTKQSLWIFGVIICLGILMNFYSGYNITTHEFIRYIFYCISPVVYIYFGFIVKKKYTYYQCLKVIYLTAFINSCKFALVAMGSIASNGIGLDVLRSTKSETTTLVVVAVFIYLLYKNKYTFFTKTIDKVIFIVSLIVSLGSFSRIYLIYLLVGTTIYIFIMRRDTNSQKLFLKILLLIGTFCIIALSVPAISSLLGEYTQKLGESLQEVTTDQNWGIKEINNSWRGYEMYMAVQQFKNADIIQIIFGYGSRGVYVGSNADLVSPDAINGFIPILHNGYFAVLTYAGIVGLSLFIAFYIANIRIGIKALKTRAKEDGLMYIILFIGLAVMTYFVTGPISPNGIVHSTIVIGIVRSQILLKRKFTHY